jgi:hypothetical protein
VNIEYLYNSQFDTSTFFVWDGMNLVDKLMYPGKMSDEEVRKTKERIRKMQEKK